MKFGSVCSGIEAASVAWEPLGLCAAWFAEIEPFPSAVLAHHWPHVTNHGDMTKLAALVAGDFIAAPEILVGGTPCQAFSVAGARHGLADERGQLTISYGELFDAIDDKRKQRGEPEAVCVWENVPGVLTSRDNAFGAFLGLLAGEDCELQPPGEVPPAGQSSKFWRWSKKHQQHSPKWSYAGCVFGPRRAIAWRTLDAQHFGVAQRRRRVFVVASAREGFDPLQVLFEYDGLRRDSPPQRGEGPPPAAAVAGRSAAGAHWDAPCNPHPTLNQSHNVGGIGASNQELFSQRGAGLVPCWWDGGQLSQTLDAVLHKGQMMPEKQRFPVVLASAPPRARKITPVEAERLQGFPDNHTLLPYGPRQKLDAELKAYYERHLNRPLTDEEQRAFCGDGPRYKAIGNSKAVPVVRWIGQRLRAVLEGEETARGMRRIS